MGILQVKWLKSEQNIHMQEGGFLFFSLYNYPCDLLQRIPLRVIKADLLCTNISSHETPVNLQVDRHQKKTLGKQIHLCESDRETFLKIC